METPSAKLKQASLILIALLGWLAVILQFYLLMKNRTTSVPEAIFRFFGFFTILTNILVATASSSLVLKRPVRWFTFFSRGTALAALTLYISVVGLVYNLVLRQLWAPQGLQRLVDELLHLVIPVLFLIYWLAWAPKQALKWNSFFPWLIYPLAYVIYSLCRGALFGFYPYPFIDVNLLGFNKVLLNSLGLTFVFVLFSLLFIGISKLMSKKHSATA